MRRWISRALPALVLCSILPAAATAQPVQPPAGPNVVPNPGNVAGDTLPAPTPGAGPGAAPVPGQGGPVIVVPNGGVIYLDPYHAATPYNPSVSQPVPNPMLNRPVTTLPCAIPNLNPDPFIKTKPGCGCGKKGWFKHGDCGCGQPCTPPNSTWGQMTHPYCGICSKGGSYTTACNTFNFALASSRSYFGESSREFFERPPSIDGVKMQPKAYSPPPAPGAYAPSEVVVIHYRAFPKQAKGIVTGVPGNEGQPPVIVDAPVDPEGR